MLRVRTSCSACSRRTSWRGWLGICSRSISSSGKSCSGRTSRSGSSTFPARRSSTPSGSPLPRRLHTRRPVGHRAYRQPAARLLESVTIPCAADRIEHMRRPTDPACRARTARQERELRERFDRAIPDGPDPAPARRSGGAHHTRQRRCRLRPADPRRAGGSRAPCRTGPGPDSVPVARTHARRGTDRCRARARAGMGGWRRRGAHAAGGLPRHRAGPTRPEVRGRHAAPAARAATTAGSPPRWRKAGSCRSAGRGDRAPGRVRLPGPRPVPMAPYLWYRTRMPCAI